jgi:hypothetical protein
MTSGFQRFQSILDQYITAMGMYNTVAPAIRHMAACTGVKIATDFLMNTNDAPQMVAIKIIRNQSKAEG